MIKGLLEKGSKVWPHARAAFVLFHLSCIFILAFPAPVGGLDRNNWKLPDVQAEFAAWAGVFHLTEPEFEDLLYQGAVWWMSIRDAAVRPFGSYVNLTGCEQPWRMFVGAARSPARLQIRAHVRVYNGGRWETLFEQDSPEFQWHADMFKQERLRSQIARWSWPGFAHDYDEGCAYIARLAFDERPDVDDVRCRFWSVQSPTLEQVRTHTEPPGQWLYERSHHRMGVAQ